ncbi:MAG: response regulator [Oxalobacteraceae bacterium]|nr:MAG: response regulator [Oxalobacteraceae bacterium]
MPIISSTSNEETISGSVVIVEDDALMYLLQSKIPCALLITDFTLPGQLDGKELAMMVHQRWPSTPIIVTTGYGTEVSRDLPAGVAFLQKPWSLDQLVQTARHMLKNGH